MRWLVLTLAVCALIACHREGGDRPLEPGPPPPHLAAVISVPTLESAMGAFASFGDAVVPGAASPLAVTLPDRLGVLVGAAGIDGYARDRPVHLVVLMPPERGAAPAYVLIVGVGDAGRLRVSARGVGLRIQRGWAAIGVRPALEAVAPWALNELIARPPPRLPTAQLIPAVIAASGRVQDARAELDALAADASGLDPSSTAAGVDTVLGGMADLEQVRVTVDASARGVALDVEVRPRPSTNLAAFVAAQQPSRFELFARLPPMAASAYLGGRVASGPYAQRLRVMASLWLDAAIADPLFAGGTGELALVHDGLGDLAVAYLKPDGTTGLLASGPGAAGHLARMEEAGAVRALPPAIGALIDDAQARGDSAIAITGDGIWLSLGTTGTTLRIHVSASVAQIATAAEMLGTRR